MHKNYLSHHSGATVTVFFVILHPHLPYLHFKNDSNNNKCHFLEKFSAVSEQNPSALVLIVFFKPTRKK